LGQWIGEITAYAGRTPCVRVNLKSSADVVFHIGTPSQPPECSVEGATLSFLGPYRDQLAVQMTLRKGTTARLSNLAPRPPGSPTFLDEPLVETPPAIAPPSAGDAGLLGQ
jgi:hypothetical protein